LFAPEVAGIVAHYLLPLLLGHRVNAQVKPLGQRDLVLRFIQSLGLLRLPAWFLLWTSHEEVPRWDPDEFHAKAVREMLGWLVLLVLRLQGEAGCQSCSQGEAEEACHEKTF